MRNEHNENGLLGPTSMLNVRAQEELVDHTINASRKSALKIFLVVFPVTIITMLVMIAAIFYFVGILKI